MKERFEEIATDLGCELFDCYTSHNGDVVTYHVTLVTPNGDFEFSYPIYTVSDTFYEDENYMMEQFENDLNDFIA